MDLKLFSYINSESPSSKNGALAGKSFAIQPNISVRGWPTEAGSKALLSFVSLETATVVERIQAKSGHVVGSTLMPELGLGIQPGTTAEV